MCINKANDEGVYTKRCRRYFFIFIIHFGFQLQPRCD